MNTTTIEMPPRQKRSLFQLAADESSLAQLLQEINGDVSDEDTCQAIDSWLQENADAIGDKLDAYLAIAAQYEASAALRKAESKRLAELAQYDANQAERLKARLKAYMESTGKTVLDTPHHRLSVVQNGGKQKLRLCSDDAEDFPPKYVAIAKLPDTDAIRRDLEQGIVEARAYGELLPRGTSLRIR